jgi:EmrB/QacA subfamily drug resistance transporter
MKNNPWSIFFATSLGIGMAYIDSSIVNVVLPTISKDFGNVNISSAQWVITSYMLVMCIFLPITGKLGDIFKHGNIYLCGFIVFTVSSLFCGLSSSLLQLIVFRGFQGCGAAMILANNQPLIINHIPKEQCGRALAVNTMILSVGSIVGPGLGGIIINWFHWRYIFFINIPLGVLGCWFSYIIFFNTNTEMTKRTNQFDLFGSLLFAAGLGAVIFLLVAYKQIFLWQTIGLVIFIFVIFTLFYLWEKKHAYPMLDFNLFKNKSYLFSTFAAFLVLSAVAATRVLLPFFLQDHLNIAPINIGLLMLISPLFAIIFSLIGGYLADYAKAKHSIVVGLVFMTLALLIQSQFKIDISQLWLITLSQILLGSGFGLFQSPNNFRILNSIPKAMIGSGNSLASLMRNAGRMSGVVFSAALFSAIEVYAVSTNCGGNCAFEKAFNITFLVISLFVILALLYSFHSSSS